MVGDFPDQWHFLAKRLKITCKRFYVIFVELFPCALSHFAYLGISYGYTNTGTHKTFISYIRQIFEKPSDKDKH